MSTDVIVAEVVGDIALVTVVASVLSAASRKCRQPGVIGQILTGLVLGPSLLGRLPGHLTSRLFPATALPYLNILAQVAVVIFMFAVGYEIEFRSLRAFRLTVPAVAIGSLVIPMGLGAGAVLLFTSRFTALHEQHVTSRPFVLFMAVALSITALPVLAAIIRERGLAGTTAGLVATSAAGLMDVAAWLVLAAAMVGTGPSPGRPWLLTLGLLTAFLAMMLLVVRPLLRWRSEQPGSMLSNPVPVAFALAMGSAWVTASLGLHPIFGGFIAGLTMRGWHGRPDAEVLRSMERVGGLLLPLFFVVTGLSLNLGSLNGQSLLLLLLVLAIACAGKLGAGYAAARIGGLRPRQAATVAALINTRGLTEIIALNVGLQAGIINSRLFTVLVLMALITTILTGPLLSLIGPAEESGPSQELALGSAAEISDT